MTTVYYDQENQPNVVIELREPVWAAVLAWLWPGAGHLYQRRYPKAMLFMICILGTFLFGMIIGRGRVVYASTKSNDFRWQYFFQLGVGAPAMPALLQAMKTKKGGDPFFVLTNRYPANATENGDRGGKPVEFQPIPDMKLYDEAKMGKPLKDGMYAPPPGKINLNENDVLGMWHLEMKHNFDYGTLFTVVAGLLNILAIYDAFAGPVILTQEELEQRKARKLRIPFFGKREDNDPYLDEDE